MHLQRLLSRSFVSCPSIYSPPTPPPIYMVETPLLCLFSPPQSRMTFYTCFQPASSFAYSSPQPPHKMRLASLLALAQSHPRIHTTYNENIKFIFIPSITGNWWCLFYYYPKPVQAVIVYTCLSLHPLWQTRASLMRELYKAVCSVVDQFLGDNKSKRRFAAVLLITKWALVSNLSLRELIINQRKNLATLANCVKLFKNLLTICIFS